MFRQNLVFAFITPIVLAAVIALIISGLGTSLLWIAEHGETTSIGGAFGTLTGLHGHDVGKGLAVLVALIYATVILAGGTLASRMTSSSPHRADH